MELGLYGPNFIETYDLRVTGTSQVVTTCATGLRITPGDLPNAEAGTWKSYVTAWGAKTVEGPGPNFSMRRVSRLTSNATPEPATQDKTITISGRLTRADWDTLGYRGYGERKVQLQWRTPQGSYHVVKTVVSGPAGGVKATIKATQDGCFRFVFPGNTTTSRITSQGDCVDVR